MKRLLAMDSYTAALISYCMDTFLFMKILPEQDTKISELYAFHTKRKKNIISETVLGISDLHVFVSYSNIYKCNKYFVLTY